MPSSLLRHAEGMHRRPSLCFGAAVSFVEGRPDLDRPRDLPYHCREGGGEYAVAQGLLGEGLADVDTQHRVGKYLIDCAVWPVAYEVWSTSTTPHRVEGQRRKIIALAEAGWCVCYLHMHTTGYYRHIDGQVFPALVQLWEIAKDGHVPAYVRVHHRDMSTAGWLDDGQLVIGEWTTEPWSTVVASQARAEAERRDLKRRDAIRRRYWLKNHGVEPPPRGRRRWS